MKLAEPHFQPYSFDQHSQRLSLESLWKETRNTRKHDKFGIIKITVYCRIVLVSSDNSNGLALVKGKFIVRIMEYLISQSLNMGWGARYFGPTVWRSLQLFFVFALLCEVSSILSYHSSTFFIVEKTLPLTVLVLFKSSHFSHSEKDWLYFPGYVSEIFQEEFCSVPIICDQSIEVMLYQLCGQE